MSPDAPPRPEAAAPRPEVTAPRPEVTARPSDRLPRALLIVLGILVVAFVATSVILLSVVRPPSYEPVPVPSVSRT